MNPSATLKLAVFGQPVSHSLSPRIHALFGEQLGIAVDYRAIETDDRALPAALKAFRNEGGTGANLTVPLKQAGVRVCEAIDPDARRARAVNTLLASESGWQGFNTDGNGLMLDFERLGIAVRDRRILVVGAGGAAAGILGPLLGRQPQTVRIVNRTAEKAERLADRFAHIGTVQGGGFESVPGSQDFDLLIQSTSAGHADKMPPMKPEWLESDGIVYDLNYGRAHSTCRQWCRQHGLACYDGLGMLVGQAALAFEIWTGRQPALTPVIEALQSAG